MIFDAGNPAPRACRIGRTCTFSLLLFPFLFLALQPALEALQAFAAKVDVSAYRQALREQNGTLHLALSASVALVEPHLTTSAPQLGQ